MTDVALLQSDISEFLYSVEGADFLTDEGLETAVIISLFTDRRVSDEELPTGADSKRGWWGDVFPDVNGDQIGSKLWTLDRSSLTEDTAGDAETFGNEALAWLVDDGVAASATVVASIELPNCIRLEVEIVKPDGSTNQFDFIWSGQEVRRA